MTPLQAGVSKIDITPPVGCDLTGFGAREGPSLAVRDPLFARALALQDSHTQAVVIACDLLGLEARFVAHVRHAVEREIGVPARHVMIAGTHTHSGPACMFLRHCGDVDATYMAQLAERLVHAARKACSTLRPASMASGKTRVSGISINRREPGGPVDEDLDLVRFDDARGNALATLLSFACHPLGEGPANRSISADFPGDLTQRVEAATGATALFLNGACAQINPLQPVPQMGATLAQAALEMRLKPSRKKTLRVRTRDLILPLQRVNKKSIGSYINEQAEVLARTASAQPGETARLQYKVASARLEWAWETRDALATGLAPQCVAAEVQTLQIGDVVLVGVPGELFVELGFVIKQALAPAHAIVVGYANDNIGYIPTRASYPQGGYEVDDAYRYYGYPAPLAPAAGEEIVRAIKDLQRPSSKAKETTANGIRKR
ncbi:MAG TPA: neutral/alkaline non-lysosomal ceramidase N-terminal domain-containing protein [Abditibacteriaceae bacterium]|nr:neutral/alkaline non-lysosomal ceramidase N-terminal domain-containing protein [Abditibacteriaceae bacterium]